MPFTDIRFTQSDMALMLGVSKDTVENHFAEFNLTCFERYSDIDDSSLDVYTKHIIIFFQDQVLLKSVKFWEYHAPGIFHYCAVYILDQENQDLHIFYKSKWDHHNVPICYCHFLFIYLGRKPIEGEWLAQGIRVQRRRIRNSVKRVDPVRHRIQTINVIRRQVYNVHSLLSLWQMVEITN